MIQVSQVLNFLGVKVVKDNTAGVSKVYTTRIPAAYNLYSGRIQFVFSRNTFCIQPVYNLYSAGIQKPSRVQGMIRRAVGLMSANWKNHGAFLIFVNKTVCYRTQYGKIHCQ